MAAVRPNHQLFSIPERLCCIVKDTTRDIATPMGVGFLTQYLPKPATELLNWGSTLYQAVSLMKNVGAGVQALYRKENGNAKQSFKDTIYDIAMLAPRFSSRPEARIISVAARLLSQGKSAYNDFARGDQLEGVVKAIFTSVTGYQLVQEAKPLYIERVGSIDAGSGNVKVSVADRNKFTGRCTIISNKSYRIAHQKGLESSGGRSFGHQIQEKSLEGFRSIRRDLDSLGVQSVVCVATEAFRKADNGQDLVDAVHYFTGLPVKIISQKTEGVIAFKSAVVASKLDPNKIVVWDIGTGSHQMVVKGENGYTVFVDGLGAVPFESHVKRIQEKPLSETPNPINTNDEQKARELNYSIWNGIPDSLKEKLEKQKKVLGIGGTFGHSVGPLVTEGKTIHRDELGKKIQERFVGHGDEVIKAGLPENVVADYRPSDITNCINVHSVMKTLNLPKVDIISTTSSTGLLSSASRYFHRLV